MHAARRCRQRHQPDVRPRESLPFRQGDNIFHFDFYRIEKLDEAYDLGYDEYFDSGALCLVEWPEKIEPLLPSDTLRVYIETTGPDSRKITIG